MGPDLNDVQMERIRGQPNAKRRPRCVKLTMRPHHDQQTSARFVIATVDSLPQESASHRNQRSELRWRRTKCSQNTYTFSIPIVIHRVDYGVMRFLAEGNLQ